MPAPHRRDPPDHVPWPYRQILERARHPSGWRSSMLTRPQQPVWSFALETLIAGAAIAIIVVLLFNLG